MRKNLVVACVAMSCIIGNECAMNNEEMNEEMNEKTSETQKTSPKDALKEILKQEVELRIGKEKDRISKIGDNEYVTVDLLSMKLKAPAKTFKDVFEAIDSFEKEVPNVNKTADDVVKNFLVYVSLYFAVEHSSCIVLSKDDYMFSVLKDMFPSLVNSQVVEDNKVKITFKSKIVDSK
jgi:hypothetical protein